MRVSRQVAREQPRERLWTAAFVTAVVVNTLVMLVFYLLMTTMALYAAQRFAASDTLAGLASSMYIIGAVGARFVAGRLVGAVAPRRVLIAALGVFIAMSLAYLVAVNLPLLFLVRFVHGFAYGLAGTAVTTIAQSIIPSRRRGEGTGYFSLSVPLATALGPLVGLALIGRWGYDMLFWASVVVSGAAFVVSLLLPEQPTADARERRGGGWRSFIERDALPVATVMLAVGVVNSAVITFTHPFTDSVGLGALAGTFFGLNAVGVVASRLFAGRVQDRFGDNWVMYPALTTYAGGIALLSQVESTTGLVVAALLVGLGFGSVMPTAQAAAVRLAPPQHIGTAIATYYLMLDIGTGVGPALLGPLVTAWDYQAMLLAVAGLVLVGAGYYHLVHGRKVRAKAATGSR